MSSIIHFPQAAVADDVTTSTDISVRRVYILGVPIADMTTDDAVGLVLDRIDDSNGPAATIFFANAHTLNLASSNAEFHAALRSVDFVFGDGTGVRWASKMQGQPLVDNVNGTDFTPRLLSTKRGRPRSYFMLGADAHTIELASEAAQSQFPDWDLVGHHHGFVQSAYATNAVIEQINDSGADVLLVGMGNPIQEFWIRRNRERINASVCIGVGGLFDFWSGNVSRAPKWLRSAGHEWLWRLWQQPIKKCTRYVVGNPLYLYRAAKNLRNDRSETARSATSRPATPRTEQSPAER